MLSQETITKFKAMLGIELPATKVEAPVVLAEVPTVDASGSDVVLSIDGDVPAIGQAVKVGDAPAADGEYKMKDGSVITVMGGLIAEIATAKEEGGEAEANPMDALMARLDAIEKQLANKSLETELSETKKDLQVALSAIYEINNASVALNLEAQKPKKVEVKFEDMTALERRRYLKSLEK